MDDQNPDAGPARVPATPEILAALEATGRLVLVDKHGLPKQYLRLETQQEIHDRLEREQPFPPHDPNASWDDDIPIEEIVADWKAKGVDVTAFEKRGLA